MTMEKEENKRPVKKKSAVVYLDRSIAIALSVVAVNRGCGPGDVIKDAVHDYILNFPGELPQYVENKRVLKALQEGLPYEWDMPVSVTSQIPSRILTFIAVQAKKEDKPAMAKLKEITMNYLAKKKDEIDKGAKKLMQACEDKRPPYLYSITKMPKETPT